ncbi:MAG: hypothetical protein AAF806_05860 [Bacteroidota bacterium]
MKSNLLACIIAIFISISFSSTNAPPKTIKVEYHLGYGTKVESDGQEIYGAYGKKEEFTFVTDKSKRFYKASKLLIKSEFRPYQDEEFKGNYECREKVQTVGKRIEIAWVQTLKALIDKVEKESVINTSEEPQIIKKKTLSYWDYETFNLKNKKLEALAREKGVTVDSLFEEITEHVFEKNNVWTVSSVVEFLKISFRFSDKQYSLTYHIHAFDKVNVSWDLDIDTDTYFLIAPELNKMVSDILPRSMKIKKKLLDFTEMNNLQNCIN